MAAWATGAWATTAWVGTAWATTTAVIVEDDTHDGGKQRDKRFKQKKAKLREDLLAAYNKTLGIEPPEEIEPAQMVQAIEDSIGHLSDRTIAEVEQRVIEKLLADYRQYELDRRMQEDEWELDVMLAIAHYVH